MIEAAPAPGEAATCETAGVLAPTVNVIASYQATEAIKILTGHRENINRDLIFLDVWENVYKRFSISKLRERNNCVCVMEILNVLPRKFDVERVHGMVSF